MSTLKVPSPSQHPQVCRVLDVSAASPHIVHSIHVGIAACNIGGVTLHSFAGIGLGAESVNFLVGKVRRSKRALTRWMNVEVLIIDEGVHELCSATSLHMRG